MLSLSFFAITLLLPSALAVPYRRSLEIPLQKRSALVARDGSVDLDALRSHATYSQKKYLQGVAVLQHNAGGVPTSSGGSLPPRAVGDDSLTPNWGQYSWYGSVFAGSPAVEYKVDFDTGSSVLFLPAFDCDSTCDGHTLYDPNVSSSAVDLHRDFTLAYGDGVVSGNQYMDTVAIAGLVATNQTIGAALHYSSHFSDSVADGLMGMSFADISGLQTSPVVQTLIAEGQLSDPVFAFKLAPSGSELRIGGVDPSLYAGPFVYAPVTQQGFWQIEIDSIDADGRPTNMNAAAILDTGTSFVLGDTRTVDAFYSATNATKLDGGFYAMPCDAMPSVSITIQGRPFEIAPDVFNLGSYNSSDNSCVGGIAARGSLGDTFILGDVFLRNVYSVFDFGGLRVGFADLA